MRNEAEGRKRRSTIVAVTRTGTVVSRTVRIPARMRAARMRWRVTASVDSRGEIRFARSPYIWAAPKILNMRKAGSNNRVG
jgi:hypothetical protein